MKSYQFRLTIEAVFAVEETAYIDSTLQPLAAECRNIDQIGVAEYLSVLQESGAEFETHLQLVCASDER